jgi:hypothetical protein
MQGKQNTYHSSVLEFLLPQRLGHGLNPNVGCPIFFNSNPKPVQWFHTGSIAHRSFTWTESGSVLVMGYFLYDPLVQSGLWRSDA